MQAALQASPSKRSLKSDSEFESKDQAFAEGPTDQLTESKGFTSTPR